MLITKTFCTAGSLVYIVPTGLLVTLHYDAHGMLNKVYQGFEDKTDLGEDFMKALVRQGLVPNTIKLHGGTTDIWGVFYSNEIECPEGILPDCEFDRIVADIISGSPKYKFYVGNVESGAMAITPSSMQGWTKMVGFESLPCWAVPVDATDSMLETYIKGNSNISFEYPLISGFIIFEGQSIGRFHRCNLKTFKVTDTPVNLIDYDGYIKYGIKYGDESLVLDYPVAVRYNIQKNSQVVVDGYHVIWSDTANSTDKDRLSTKITCSTCHKILDVPEAGQMTCSDDFCISRMYPRIKRFCSILSIDELSTDEFDKVTKSGDISIFPDFLLLPQYKDVKIKKPLSEIVYAVVSGEVGLNREWLIKLCNKCNNSFDTLKYYLVGPLRIKTELDMDVPPRFMRWISEPRNLVELETIINSEQIEIDNDGKLIKFDGAPVLRDKRVMITGKFLHGSTEDIIAILQSYSATVVTTMDKKVSCVVVGDIKENIDGLAIQAARELDIPLFDESKFFERYSIDEDLEKFLK